MIHIYIYGKSVFLPPVLLEGTYRGKEEGTGPFNEFIGKGALTSSNKKLLETSASLVVTGALLVVTRSF